jgi:hypothetical protein
MDDRLIDYLLRAGAVLLTVAGLIVVLVGYLGVRDHADIVLQLPYLMSGGLGGLALIGLGALLLIQYQMRLQARRHAEVTDQLEEWKETALAEVRNFLERAEIEIEVAPPATPVQTNSRRRSTVSLPG